MEYYGTGALGIPGLMPPRIQALIDTPDTVTWLLGCGEHDWMQAFLTAHVIPGRVTVHCAYVKRPWRREGQASALLSMALAAGGPGAELRHSAKPAQKWAVAWLDALGSKYVRPAAFLAANGRGVTK